MNSKTILGYDFNDLIVFAEACKAQGVTNDDLKRVATDIEWAVKTAYKEIDRQIEKAQTKLIRDIDNNVTGAELKIRMNLPPVNLERFKNPLDTCYKVKIGEVKSQTKMTEIRDKLLASICEHCDTTAEERLKDELCENCPIKTLIKEAFDHE